MVANWQGGHLVSCQTLLDAGYSSMQSAKRTCAQPYQVQGAKSGPLSVNEPGAKNSDCDRRRRIGITISNIVSGKQDPIAATTCRPDMIYMYGQRLVLCC